MRDNELFNRGELRHYLILEIQDTQESLNTGYLGEPFVVGLVEQVGVLGDLLKVALGQVFRKELLVVGDYWTAAILIGHTTFPSLPYQINKAEHDKEGAQSTKEFR